MLGIEGCRFEVLSFEFRGLRSYVGEGEAGWRGEKRCAGASGG
jgi:hypothetical protein